MTSSAASSLSTYEQPSPLLSLLADKHDPPKTGALRYYDDPAGFARDCIRYRRGERPSGYQEHALAKLHEHRRLAVRGPHGLGKTCLAAWAVLWLAVTRDAAGVDWKAITTAGAWRQLTVYLWPEIRKWARQLDWDRLGRGPFTAAELLTLSLKLTTGEASAAACTDPKKIEGAHADCLLFIYDESKAISAATFDATEGAFAGAGSDTGREAFALAISTPGAPAGRFYEIHARRPGLEDWHSLHVTLEDTILSGRVSREWAENRAKLWGEQSAVYRSRVLGEFAGEDEGVIPLAWVEAAIERWHALPEQHDDVDPLDVIGVDVADTGTNQTVLALRYGLAIRELRRFSRQDPMQTAGHVAGILEANWHPARQITAVVDAIGVGAGVVPRLRETTRANIVAFVASEASARRDRSGELGYANCRAAAWWNLREMLDPDLGEPVALPPDDALIGDLTVPRWRMTSGGKVLIESKEDIAKRLGRSTDDGDAVVMAFWPEGGIAAHVRHFVERKDASFFASHPTSSRWKVD